MKEPSYKKYLLTVLLITLAFNQADRLALGLVLQDIKVELHLSDTQLGLLTGIAFALFYSAMGIPIARWADRGNRVTIISVTTALWSAAVALSALAGNFLQLLLIRIGVAVGEAGCIPPAHSLIADHFPRAERPRAVAIYMLGVPLSGLFGYLLAGWLNEWYGWRVTFIVLGLPGMALALLTRYSLTDPRLAKRISTGARDSAAALPQAHLKEVLLALWRNATFRHLMFGFSVLSFFGYGITTWQPAFFVRSYGLPTGELGNGFAVVYGVCGLLGTYCGGELASRYAANNERLQLKAMAAACCLFAVLSACIYLSPTHYLAFAFMGLAAVGGAAINGPMFATIQTVAPQHMRAVSIALIFLVANLLGMGLGPLAAGILSDALRPLFGEESLRYVLLVLSLGYLWAALHLRNASATVTRCIEREQAE